MWAVHHAEDMEIKVRFLAMPLYKKILEAVQISPIPYIDFKKDLYNMVVT